MLGLMASQRMYRLRTPWVGEGCQFRLTEAIGQDPLTLIEASAQVVEATRLSSLGQGAVYV